MLNPFKEINWSPERKDLQSFGKSIACGFAIFAIIFLAVAVLKGAVNCRFGAFAKAFAMIAILAYILSRLAPVTLRVFYLPWFFISACIGFIVINLFLLIFYYMIFSAFACVFRLFSKRDPLQLKKGGADSFWSDCAPIKSKKSYFRQY